MRAANPLSRGLLVLTWASACGEAPVAIHSVVDAPQGKPAVVDAPQGSSLKDRGGVSNKAIANCERGTGKRPDGTCVQMRSRVLTHGQQVQIPGGRFIMGQPPTRYDTTPTRQAAAVQWPAQPPRLAVADSFWIDLHEVSRRQYAACVDKGVCTAAACPGGQDPVAHVGAELAPMLPQTCVRQEQAAAFCQGVGGRLPTEVEWEYAARGPDARPFPWGAQLRDEYHARLVPVGGLSGDLSFFGMLGMGTNAKEWTSSRFDPDLLLAPFVRGFRRADGPLARARAGTPAGYVSRGGRTSARYESKEPAPRLGFRCAASVDPNEEPLTVPQLAPPVPSVARASAELQLFGGVAEAVDRAEAEAFCAGLTVTWEGQELNDWALPTLTQIQAVADSFRGPGPFWTEGGAAVQRGPGLRPRPVDPWVAEEVAAGDALAVRCLRSTGSASSGTTPVPTPVPTPPVGAALQEGSADVPAKQPAGDL